MNSPTPNAWGNQPDLKVSISARLIPALAYTIPAIGGALSSLWLMNVMWMIRQAETAGIAAVMAGMAEATLPILVSLYLAVIFGIVVIAVLIVRMVMETATASPPGWFFVACLLCLLPAGLFGEAQSLIIEVLMDPRNSTGLAGVASNISWLLMLSVLAAPVVFLLLIAASVLKLKSRTKPKWGPLIAAIVVEILLIAAAAAFQMRFLWLYQSVADV